MRVIFVSLASAGHTYPMVPLAVAARDAGHDVRFAAGEAVHAVLAEQGLRPFRPADCFYDVYAEDLAPELDRLRPDLVVHGWGVPGAGVAAARAGVPALWHGFGRMFPEGIGLERPGGGVHLDICPPSLQDPDFLAHRDRIALRPVPFSTPAAPVRHDRPLVYLTLGTAFGTPELLATAVHALSALDVHVLVATGRVPVDQLGEVPPGVTVRPWVAQADLWPHVDLVVHHGGSGTTLGALAAGVPQLLLPQGADQFANADAVHAAGAGLRAEETRDAITAAARELLRDGGYREAARVVADEVARMPSPEEVARRLPEFTG
ncbi:glycosyltransferase [Saccharothrix obliqua]|uniref:glycosyltransferase n=1 Tax=Saccharothrix obliqua TaxID=2861747 RepID=UPI001C5D292F|nr:glycosyltransferase [Saccharothrix obliqua]MBW4720300.1 glycosyltransferase [Saccharothrix obliqua]